LLRSNFSVTERGAPALALATGSPKKEANTPTTTPPVLRSASCSSRVVDEFLNGESRLLCLSLGAGAYGLNLVPGPSAMIILDVWFNPAVHRQVEARIRRIGQTKPVVIHTLVTRGSIEESILATHNEKERCASAMISGDVNSITTDDHPSDHRIARTCEPLKAHASAM
jgi:hypothetical protein